MKDVFSLLRQKEEQLQLLARQVEALRVAAQLIREEEKLLGKRDPDTPSQPEMIRAVLAAHGKPMHVSQISDAIRQKFNKKIKVAYLTAILYRTIKANRFFYKVKDKPNTFGLLSWQGNGSAKLSVPLEVHVAESLRSG